MPSQHGEHLFIEKHFKGRMGQFLDVGAYDGVTFSNTRGLSDMGWPGVCVEPNPMIHQYLQQNIGDRPVKAVPMALIPNDRLAGPQRFWATQDLLSTLEAAHRAKIIRWNPKFEFLDATVPGIHWADLLRDWGTPPFDFVNIDVEGINWEILRDAPWDKIGAEMVCVEIDPKETIPDMQRVLSEAGLTHSKIIGDNLLAWRNS